jgi:hypothetical protein
MNDQFCCTRCYAKAKLLQVAGGIEWWRCTVPACGYLFSAWVRSAPSRSPKTAFPVGAALPGAALPSALSLPLSAWSEETA